MLLAAQFENYRSLRRLRLELGQLCVIVGPNGSGKTNIYQALRLLAAASRGDFLQTMALEGGLPSVKWAGPPPPKTSKKAPFRMQFGVEFDDLCYRMALGFPPASDNTCAPDGWYFGEDPHVKEELIWPRAGSERSYLFKRTATFLAARDGEGHPSEYPLSVASWELGLSELREPNQFPAVDVLRRRLGAWRFYHGFRSDPAAPARGAHVGFHSPVLQEDGQNLASTLRTIIEVGDDAALRTAVADAFDGARVLIDKGQDRTFRVQLEMPGLFRPLSAPELSDGQLRFLCLAAALLSPRPPQLMVFNEPEASLHDRLLPAVARLVAAASPHVQLCITTHSRALAAELAGACKPQIIELEKVDGQTRVREQ